MCEATHVTGSARRSCPSVVTRADTQVTAVRDTRNGISFAKLSEYCPTWRLRCGAKRRTKRKQPAELFAIRHVGKGKLLVYHIPEPCQTRMSSVSKKSELVLLPCVDLRPVISFQIQYSCEKLHSVSDEAMICKKCVTSK